MAIKNDCPLCRNGAEISNYIGVDKNRILYLKEKYKLPVFKIEGKGNWKALKSSLDSWTIKMEDKFL